MMTPSMTSQGSLKIGPLYSFINEITTFSLITKKTKISSLNHLCIGIMRLWLHLYKSLFMTSLMMSPGQKVGQFRNWSPSIFQLERQSKSQNIGNTRGYLAGIVNLWYYIRCDLNMAAILKILKYLTQINLTSGMKRPSQIMPKKYFSRLWRHRWHHSVASKLPSIFMFWRGWLRQQVARAISRQWMPIS